MNEGTPATGPAGTARPRRTPVADLFEETFRLYRGHFAAMVLAFAAFEIPIILAMLPLTTWQARWSQNLYSPSGADLQRALDELGPFLTVSVLFGLVAVILGAFAAAGVTYIAGRARAGDRPSAREAFPVLRTLAPKILGYVGLILAATLLLGIGLVAIGLFGFGVGAGRALSTLLVVVAVFAAIAVVIVGVARLALVIPALVLEQLGPVDAVRRSWTLVGGSTMRTFGIVLLAGLVVTVIASIATPAYLPGLMEGILTGSVGSFVLVALVGGVVQTLLGPILPTLLTVLYFDYVAYRPEV